MTFSYINIGSKTFSEQDAIKLGASVITDLYQLSKFYGKPSGDLLEKYKKELTVYLVYKSLEYVAYGYQKSGNWVPGASFRYEPGIAQLSGSGGTPGGIRAGVNISGASWGSYLVTNFTYEALSPSDKEALHAELPFEREGAPAPGTGGASWVSEKNYYHNGVSIERKVLK